MKTNQIIPTANLLCAKMQMDGYNSTTINTTNWVLQHFNDYCVRENIVSVNINTATRFILECYGFNLYKPFLPVHSTLRRPVLSLLDFYDTGEYSLMYSLLPKSGIPNGFEPPFMEYRRHIQTLDYCKDTKAARVADFNAYLKYLSEHGISDIRNADRSMVYSYINDIQNKYSPKTMKTLKYSLKMLHDWLYSAGYLPYDGKMIFPWIQDVRRSQIPSYYTKDEVRNLLDSIDTSTAKGKFYYCVLCLAAYLGMRSGDIINLKFSEIDWENDRICYVQKKTGLSQMLPLLDAVKYPLVDYIRNARKNCGTAQEFVFIRQTAPFTKYKTGKILCRIVTDAMKTAGIDIGGRHHGPHALRHSLASNLLSEDVEIYSISGILGHSTTMTTEIYLTIDETHLKELTLEVPGYED